MRGNRVARPLDCHVTGLDFRNRERLPASFRTIGRVSFDQFRHRQVAKVLQHHAIAQAPTAAPTYGFDGAEWRSILGV